MRKTPEATARIARAAVRIVVATGSAALVALFATWIAITQPAPSSVPTAEGVRADRTALERHVRFLSEDAAPRSHRNPENLARVSDYIRGALEGAGAEVRFQSYFAGGAEHRNVVGRLGPGGPARVVVGAHYDVYAELPGADDNASGVAGLLETARLLGNLEGPPAVELVAYSTEEPPFFGSSAMGSAQHAAALEREGTAVRAMICLEMIGYFSDRQPAPNALFGLLYPKTGDFILVAGRWKDRPLIREVKRSMREVPGLEVRSYCGPTSVGTDLSDQRNYWDRGIPAVMITDTAFVRNPHYHTAGDTAETLDYDRMSTVVEGVVRAVVRIAASDEGNRRAR